MASATAPVSASTRRRTLTELARDPRRTVLLAVVLMTFVTCIDVLHDPDVWWHLRLGQWIIDHHRLPGGELFSYTAAGKPFTAHEWFADVIFASVHAVGGMLAIAIVCALVSWSGLVALVLRARDRRVSPLVIAVGIAIGAKASQVVLGSRPQVATFALACWTLLIAERYLAAGGRRRWLLPPLFLLWANVHAGFLIGFALLVLVLLAEGAKRWFNLPAAASGERVLGLAVALAASAVAACVNPSGPGLYLFAITSGAAESGKAIVEWQSPNFHETASAALLLLIVTYVILAAWNRRPDLRDSCLAAAGIALALIAVRNTALCVAALLPTWCALLHVTTEDVRRGLRNRRSPMRGVRAAQKRGAAVLCALIMSCALGVATASLALAARDASAAGVASRYPACATDVLVKTPAIHRIFAAYGDAGYLIYRRWPDARVYEYGESISLGQNVFNDYIRIAMGERTSPSALALLERSRTDAVLVPAGQLTVSLDAVPDQWQHLVDDAGLRLYARTRLASTLSHSC